jgi:uncharacterized protein (DUF433 family)
MPCSPVGYRHVVLDERGVALVEGTTLKVLELAAEHRAYRWDAEQLRIQHPDLSLGQIYSALAYYADHRAELDDEIDRRLAAVDRMPALSL